MANDKESNSIWELQIAMPIELNPGLGLKWIKELAKQLKKIRKQRNLLIWKIGNGFKGPIGHITNKGGRLLVVSLQLQLG